MQWCSGHAASVLALSSLSVVAMLRTHDSANALLLYMLMLHITILMETFHHITESRCMVAGLSTES